MKILLVHVSEDIANALRLLCSSKKHETFIATNGDEALNLVQSASPDVVILDLGLPEKAMGLEVCRIISRSSDAVIITLSESAAATDRVAAFEAGAHQFLLKPVDVLESEGAIE